VPPGDPATKLFINYRREDTAPYAGRLYDRLTAHFGQDQVFIDIDQIDPGEDFVEAINSQVGACDIAIVSIGPNWLTAADASGQRRLDDEEDFVRMEIIAALERKIRVIPVLVGGARMPRKQDLPDALAPLSRRNAIELSETRFHSDVSRLIEAIEKPRAFPEKKRESFPVPVATVEPAPAAKLHYSENVQKTSVSRSSVEQDAKRQRQWAEQEEKNRRANDAAHQREIAEQQRLAIERKTKAEEVKEKEDLLRAVAAASKEQPYVNSLGMKFVPVPETGVLFSIWETRVQDYTVFVKERHLEWPKPSFQQTKEHPAVNVSWENATAFCEWLTQRERIAVRISATQSYRLPSDEEWSAAVGLEKEGGSTPKERQEREVKGVYPWGAEWPPPRGAGNYDPTFKADDYKNTSTVGSFEANQYGIHDLGGNVWDWCQDWYDAEKKCRVVRGASWLSNRPDFLLSSYRDCATPEYRSHNFGFRCVLVIESPS
jgi:formylglycine-generating enzyme required for sulfatase activity